MASFQRDEDDLVTCPYNPCHKMKRCRLQIHITKCQQRNEDEAKRVCPFNAQHHISAPEYNHHLKTCPNRDTVDRKITKCSVEEKIEFPPSFPIQHAECWDNEILPFPAPVYDPKESQRKPIFQDTTGMLPSERKKLYKSLHSINRETLSEPEKENIAERSWTLKELRQPKAQPEVMQFRPLDAQSSSLGLGRGQPSSTRRIAANIFGPTKAQDKEISYQGRGVGRGFQINGV